MNTFNKNFLRLLKVKSLDDKRKVLGFINKYDIDLVDKEESSQGYLNVIYKGHDFVISKDYTGQTALYVNTHNLHIWPTPTSSSTVDMSADMSPRR